MSVESDVQAGVQKAPAPPAPAGNPTLLGLATFLPGALCLGLWLVGYLPAADLGGIAPAVLASSGLFLLISSVWAARIGSSLVSGILGTFSAFWLSLGLMVAAITNGWLGLTATSNPLPTFLLAWLVVFVVFTVATLRLPLAFTVGFLFVDIAVALVLTYVLTTTQLYATLAGVGVFIFSAIYAYIWFDGVTQELGGKAMAMGNAMVK
jgi:Predicted membrane protein